MRAFLTRHLSIIAMAVVVTVGSGAIMAWAVLGPGSMPGDGQSAIQAEPDSDGGIAASALGGDGELAFVSDEDITISKRNATEYLAAVKAKVDSGRTISYQEARDVVRASLLVDKDRTPPVVVLDDASRFSFVDAESDGADQYEDEDDLRNGDSSYFTTSEAVFEKIGAGQFTWSGPGGDVGFAVSNRGEILHGSMEVFVD